MTSPSCSFFIHWSSAILVMPGLSDSAVERRLADSFMSESFRVSGEPWTLRGGVGGEKEGNCSVGRKAAGTYSGALGERNWRFCRGRGWFT